MRSFASASLLLRAGVVVFALAACSSPSRPTRLITGHLDVAHYHLAGAQVVAMSSSGHVFRAPIAQATGAFRIALPVGSTYMLRFANTTASRRLFDAFAVLAPMRPTGVRTHWVTLTAGRPIDLGRIAKAGTLTSQTLQPLDDGGGGDDSADNDSADHDNDGEEDDDADACDLDDGADMEDADSERDILDDTDSDQDGVADSQDSSDDRPACTSARDDGDDCELNDDQENDDERDDDAPCNSGGGGGAGSGGGGGGNPPAVRGVI
ncbi:MAG TPA: hypothetical protein VKN99_25590 [Polyangia bacterium]|nr:hypothetical protein [Polyangia bacterium]